MGKWIAVGLLALVGFSLLGGQYTLIGLVMLLGAGLIVFLSLRGGRGRSYAPSARTAQLSAARYDAREEISRAERDAVRTVRVAQEDAEAEGREALRAVMAFLSQEARWV